MNVRTLIAAACIASMPATVAADTVAIVNGTIHTVGPAGTIDGGTVLFQDGVITAVGETVPVPADARVIDAAGRPVTPGLFNVMTKMGLYEVGQVRTANDFSVSGAPFTAAFDVAKGYNPNSSLIPVTRVDGITRAMTTPSNRGALFSGMGAIVHLGDGDDYLVKGRAAQFLSLSDGATSVVGGTRGAIWTFLEQAFADARHYDNNRRNYDQGRTRDYVLHAMDLDALLPVLDGEMPLVVDVDRESDIRNVIDLAQRYRLKVVLISAKEAWRAADALAAARIPVIIEPSNNLPTGFDNIYATLDNARLLHDAGVPVIVATTSFNDYNNPRNVTQLAGIAVANGLPWDAALAAMTRTPAEAFGVAAQFGTLESGKDADVVIWEDDPLELMTMPTHVFIRGQDIPMDSRQIRLRDRYRNLADPTPMQFR